MKAKILTTIYLMFFGAITLYAQQTFKDTNGKYGIKDAAGKIIVAGKYDYASEFSEGLAVVALKGKYGFIDKTGKEVITLKYDDTNGFIEGLAIVSLNGKYGFIDKTGKEITAIKYDMADDFTEGLAIVTLSKKRGFIDKTGREIIPLKYDAVGKFENGKAKVTLNGRTFYIDKTGKEIGATQPANSNTNSQPATNGNAINYSKLTGVWNITTKDHQTGVTGNMKFELKNVNGNLEAWRVVNGKADIRYTSFKVFKDGNTLSFNFELNIPPGIKSEGTGAWNNELTQMTGIQLTSGMGLRASAQWSAVKEATSNAPVKTNPIIISANILNEDFTDNRNKWSTNSNNEAATSISNGQYIFEMKQSYYYFNWLPETVLSKINQQKDFTMGTEFSVLSGYEEYPVWFLWGHKDMQNQFAFYITATGRYEYTKKVNGVVTVIIPAKSSTAIKKGKNVANKLHIKKTGNKIEFYINDILVDAVPYENFNPQTSVGFLLQNLKKIAIDYIRIAQ